MPQGGVRSIKVELRMEHDCMPEGGRAIGAPLHRDNSRFKFFYVNGSPELPDDLDGTISTTPIPQLIRARAIAR